MHLIIITTWHHKNKQTQLLNNKLGGFGNTTCATNTPLAYFVQAVCLADVLKQIFHSIIQTKTFIKYIGRNVSCFCFLHFHHNKTWFCPWSWSRRASHGMPDKNTIYSAMLLHTATFLVDSAVYVYDFDKRMQDQEAEQNGFIPEQYYPRVN